MSYENNKLMNLEDGRLILEAIDNKINDEITTLDNKKADIEDLYTYKETSGSIVVIDDAIAEPIKQMQIEINPVQDLHGYDSPWPGGSGKNLTDESIAEWVEEYTISTKGAIGNRTAGKYSQYFYPITPNETYTASCKKTEVVDAGYLVILYDAEFVFKRSILVYASTDPVGQYSNTFTTASDEVYYRLSISMNEDEDRMLELGSIASSYEPYSNICPISGWTKCNITRTGKNLFDPDQIPYSVNSNINSSGEIGSNDNYNVYKLVLPVGNYFASEITNATANNQSIRIATYTESDELINYYEYSRDSAGIMEKAFSVGSTAAYVLVMIRKSCQNPYIVMEESETEYESYAGEEYAITFPSLAGTVYSGTLTINNDRTGTLVVDKESIMMADLTWATEAQSATYDTFKTVRTTFGGMKSPIISNVFHYDGTNPWNMKYTTTSSNNYLYISVPTLSSFNATALVALLNEVNAQMVFDLATPQTYQLTSSEIDTILETVDGINTVRADTGDILSMTYGAGNILSPLYANEHIYNKEESNQRYAKIINTSIVASTNTTSFSDGADRAPVKLKTSIESVQDLNGYDYAWLPGGNKNLIPDGTDTNNGYALNKYLDANGVEKTGNSNYISEYFPVTANATYTFSSKDNIANLSSICFYDENKTFISGVAAGQQNQTIVAPANAVYARGTQMKDLSQSIIQFEEGSTATTQVPYSNVCPINGWNNVKIVKGSTNLIPTTLNTENGAADGYLLNASSSAANSAWAISEYIPVEEGKMYVLNMGRAYENLTAGIGYYDINQNRLYVTAYERQQIITYIIPNGVAYVKLSLIKDQFNAGASFSEANEYIIIFPSSTGTVYGGSLTINKNGTGELYIDKIGIDLGAETWTYESQYVRFVSGVQEDVISTPVRELNGICSCYPIITDGRSLSSTPDKSLYGGRMSSAETAPVAIFIKDSSFNGDIQAFTQAMQGQLFVCDLKEPQTLQLSTAEVCQILSTQGRNAFYSNVGDILSIDYSADTKLYIDKLNESKADKTEARVYYGTCSTGASTQQKVVTLVGDTPSELREGMVFVIKFTTATSYNGKPTLKIGSFPAVSVNNGYRYMWNSNSTMEFVYTNSLFEAQIAGTATTTYYGVTKLTSSTSSTSEVLAATAKGVKTAYDQAVKVMVGAGETAGAAGRVPAPAIGDDVKFLKGDGTWDNVPNPQVMTGATSSTDGTSGLIPAPSMGDQDKVLKGDGTWGTAGLDPSDIANNLETTVAGKVLDARQGKALDEKKIDKTYENPDDFTQKTWTGLSSLPGCYIWTDGDNIYYSKDTYQYVLDKSTSTWNTKTWTWLTRFYGDYIWTDGDNIYYSNGTIQCVLDKSTLKWSNKTWTGMTDFDGNCIWTDGDNIYYSQATTQDVLDKSTSTWSYKAWTGYTTVNGGGVWSDGDNIYYSNGSNQYVLDKSTSTWNTKTWTGLTNFSGAYIWSDGDNIYYSNNSNQYVLNKSTSTWSAKTWTGFTNIYGDDIWTDGENIYHNTASSSHVYNKKRDKILLGTNGEFTPVNLEDALFTGATSSSNGAAGLVPAPETKDEGKYLKGDGTWETAPGARIIQVTTTVTNTSGSYTTTIQDSRVSADMKALNLEIANPYVFNDKITVTCDTGIVTLSCNDVEGTSDVTINIIKAELNTATLTTEEFDILNADKVSKDELEEALASIGTGIYVVTLDAVTNTSGSYTHTTTVSGMTGDLKAVKLECSDPTIFRAPVSIVTGSDSVTLTCSNVVGSSTVKASFLAVGNGNPLSSSEYAALDTRIGQLADLDTTDKTDIVSAINELAAGGDTGWSTINSTYPLYLRVKNGIVFIVFRLSGGATPTDGEVLYTLPSAYCPPTEMTVATHNLRGNILVKPSGQISVNANTGQTLNNYMGAIVSYPI